MSPAVPFVVAGAAVVGIGAGAALAYVLTTGLIEFYVRHSRYREYSLPVFPWSRPAPV